MTTTPQPTTAAVTHHPLWKPLARNAPKNCVRYQVLALLRQQGVITTARLHELRPDITISQGSTHLYKLAGDGHCWNVRLTHHCSIYFATPELRDEYLQTNGQSLHAALRGDTAASKTLPIRAAAMRLDPQAPVSNLHAAKVTVYPGWTHDPRYQLPPGTTRLPPGMQGAGFVAEWEQRRQQRRGQA